MTDEEALAYVKATAATLSLPLDELRALRVATNLARTSVLAGLLDAVPLSAHDELAEIYRPAPFPAAAGSAEAP